MKEITLERFLTSSGHSIGTVKSYLYQIEHYLGAYPEAKNFNHQDVLRALEEIQKYKPSVTYRIAILSAIKKYYDYLIETGQRKNHPCKTLTIKHHSNRQVIHSDLFSSSELELLMDRNDRYSVLKIKNQVVISLLIYQGLNSSEITEMKVSHVDLEKGLVFVKESRELTRRHLELLPKQYSIFYKYITETRKELLKTDTDKLVIGKLGFPSTTGEVGYLVEQFKPMFPGRNLNPSTIRLSVISNWLNEKKFAPETVQLMAGHKWLSTTLRYRHTADEEKRMLVNRHHPLK